MWHVSWFWYLVGLFQKRWPEIVPLFEMAAAGLCKYLHFLFLVFFFVQDPSWIHYDVPWYCFPNLLRREHLWIKLEVATIRWKLNLLNLRLNSWTSWYLERRVLSFHILCFMFYILYFEASGIVILIINSTHCLTAQCAVWTVFSFQPVTKIWNLS